MNKADLLEALQRLLRTNSSTAEYDQAINDAIELVQDLTCITDPTFPKVIKDPVVLRDYGILYLVMDASDGQYYVARQTDWLYRNKSFKGALYAWETFYLPTYYPETGEVK